MVGLGKKEKFNLEVVRQAAAAAIQRAQELNAEHVASIVHGAGIGGLSILPAAQAIVVGSSLAMYRYKNKPKTKGIKEFTVVEFDKSKIEQVKEGVNIARAECDGVCLARDLVNMPPNFATPTKLASVAEEIAESHDMDLIIGDRDWAAKHEMGAFLSVAKGAAEPPKFIILDHNPSKYDKPPNVIIGKGITFDSGGLSLKPVQGMGRMKSDMAGAAAVLGTMKVVGLLKIPRRIVCIAPCTENMPDASAYHPADVITASNGKTIEIITTDAEGRMVLDDALVYAQRYKQKAVLDVATLTSSCVIALGRGISAGLFCNDETLKTQLLESSGSTNERLWPLPLWDDYKRTISSSVADIKNSGGQYGGVGTSAIFLKQFIDYPWAHIDMSSMALADSNWIERYRAKKEGYYIRQGGTGFGVRLLVDYLRKL